MRLIDADALMADCQLAQKQADRHGREFANAFYSGGCEISTEWWCVEDLIENAPTIEPERKKGKWIKKMRVNETEKYTSYDPDWYCACCGAKYDPYIARMVNFCYVCGADMRGEQE